MSFFAAPNLIALATLTALEIVLGIDNLIFISVLVERIEKARRESARRLGLFLAMSTRILLLLTIKWIMLLTSPLFALVGHSFSGRDLVMLIGGLFLIAKATHEIHNKISGESDDDMIPKKRASYVSAIVQIALLDIVFSLDSVITAVGMAEDIRVMIAAIVVSVGIMLFFAKAVGDFIEQYPAFKMLALSFLLLVGVMLFAEGFGMHVDKAYIYFAIGFSSFVEMLNTRLGKRRRAGGHR